MPEGHLVHRHAADHQAALAGRALGVSSPQGRVAGVETVDGAVLDAVEAYGKHLFYRFAAERLIHVHLGKQGVFLDFDAGSRAPARPHVRLRLDTGEAGTDLVAPMVCELTGPGGYGEVVSRLGPDPLRADADPGRVRAALAASRASVGAALLDQSVVSGMGNVLRAEVLFLLGLHPERPAADLSDVEFDQLWDGMTTVMRDACREGRIVTVPHDEAEVRRLPRQETTWVYGQKECRRCRTPVTSWTLAGRTAYACPTCQPRAA
jgi:endonuclease-8